MTKVYAYDHTRLNYAEHKKNNLYDKTKSEPGARSVSNPHDMYLHI